MFFKDSHKLEYLMASDATSISISTMQDTISLLTRFAFYNVENCNANTLQDISKAAILMNLPRGS